jgi:hypothetical protein
MNLRSGSSKAVMHVASRVLPPLVVAIPVVLLQGRVTIALFLASAVLAAVVSGAIGVAAFKMLTRHSVLPAGWIPWLICTELFVATYVLQLLAVERVLESDPRHHWLANVLRDWRLVVMVLVAGIPLGYQLYRMSDDDD